MLKFGCGDYKARTIIAYQQEGGQAVVIDRYILEFDWDLNRHKVVGPIKFQNAKSQVSDLQNVERSCPPPVTHGDYEHFEIVSARDTGEAQGGRTP